VSAAPWGGLAEGLTRHSGLDWRLRRICHRTGRRSDPVL